MTLEPNTIQNLMYFFGGVSVAAIFGIIEVWTLKVRLSLIAHASSDFLKAADVERAAALKVIMEQNRVIEALREERKEHDRK